MKTLAVLSQILLLGLGTFLMIVILLQRGRGGGLAGAFGGLGGQSAFGTKAGDVFTRITIGLAVAWVIVAGGSGYFLRAGAEERAAGLGDGEAGISAGELPEGDADFDPVATDDALGGADITPPPAPEEDATATPPAEGSTPASQDEAPGDGAAGDNAAETPASDAPAGSPESSQQ